MATSTQSEIMGTDVGSGVRSHAIAAALGALTVILFASLSKAEVCTAVQQTLPSSAAAAGKISSDAIKELPVELEKSLVQDGEVLTTEFNRKEDSPLVVQLRAVIDQATSEIQLTIKDPKSQASASSTGSFSQIGVFAVKLTVPTETAPVAYTLTCQKQANDILPQAEIPVRENASISSAGLTSGSSTSSSTSSASESSSPAATDAPIHSHDNMAPISL